MSEGCRSGIDGFDGPERVTLEHDVGTAEVRVAFDFVGVELEELGDDGDVVGLEAHGVEVGGPDGFLADEIVEAGAGGVKDVRVGGREALGGDWLEVEEGLDVGFGVLGAADVEDVDCYYGLWGSLLVTILHGAKRGTNLGRADVGVECEESVVDDSCRHGTIGDELVQLFENRLDLVLLEDHGIQVPGGRDLVMDSVSQLRHDAEVMACTAHGPVQVWIGSGGDEFLAAVCHDDVHVDDVVQHKAVETFIATVATTKASAHEAHATSGSRS